MPNEEHRKSQWTFEKFSSKIIGAKLQFSKALNDHVHNLLKCLLCPLYVQCFGFTDLLRVRCENRLHSSCQMVCFKSQPTSGHWQEQTPCASAGWDAQLRHTQAMSWALSVPGSSLGFVLEQPGCCSAQAAAGISFGSMAKLAQESSQAGRIQLEAEEKVTKETWAGTWCSCSEQCKLITWLYLCVHFKHTLMKYLEIIWFWY